ncbi:hypothetical protein [Uliginosibacterium sp. TH139]|uniref:hypothetical protein n=1 Tax=Uliginosibacterium sp. TH139 TaxID=2067453 RepID=UPI00117E1911|nr:hypothetical protein [Uliginosibacterium sp. TH139]
MADILWQRPWRAVYDASLNDEARSLQDALDQELSISHPLFSEAPKVIGRSTSGDDVVAQMNDGSFALIHLTWQGKPDQIPEKFPAWSRVKTVEHLNSVIAQDAKEYDDEDL